MCQDTGCSITFHSASAPAQEGSLNSSSVGGGLAALSIQASGLLEGHTHSKPACSCSSGSVLRCLCSGDWPLVRVLQAHSRSPDGAGGLQKFSFQFTCKASRPGYARLGGVRLQADPAAAHNVLLLARIGLRARNTFPLPIVRPAVVSALQLAILQPAL